MSTNEFVAYRRAVSYLETLPNIPQPDYMVQRAGRAVFLKRFAYFLKLTGNPERGQTFVHVGGTSGKGSVATMLHSVLVEGGLHAGLYTSPYTTTPIEKIVVGRQLISASEFSNLVEKLKPAVDRAYVRSPYGRPSWFEIYTALALLYFKRQRCDVSILEVGLGGRFDATNVIAAPKVTIINRIGLDHVDLLGHTLRDIAREKAGIIKPKTAFFTTSANAPAVKKLFANRCRQLHASYTVVAPPTAPFALGMQGKHQQHNAALAAAAAKRFDVSDANIKAGLRHAKLPCRFETIQKKPLVILDGAHNESKMETVVEELKNLTYKKLYLIIALTSERSAATVFKKIIPLASQLYLTRFTTAGKKCYPPLKLQRQLKLTRRSQIFLDPFQALDAALQRATPSDLVLITGSLYLTGEVRTYWRPEETIIRERTS